MLSKSDIVIEHMCSYAGGMWSFSLTIRKTCHTRSSTYWYINILFEDISQTFNDTMSVVFKLPFSMVFHSKLKSQKF